MAVDYQSTKVFSAKMFCFTLISSDISIQSTNVLFVKHILDTYLPKFSTTKVLCSTLVIKVAVNRKLQKFIH